VAPVTFHCNVEEPPAVMLIGLPEKLFISGTPDAGFTITVADEFDNPYKLDAVIV
jgi:hypothetical protein